MAAKQTAGREKLGKIAPQFAQLNDDVLFGEVWSREKELCPRERSLITIAALFSAGQYEQLKSHLQKGKENGISRQEAVEVATQLAFYCGWPKAWSVFPIIKEVYGDSPSADVSKRLSEFPIGEPNDAFAEYFVGKSYLKQLSDGEVKCFNVTFEPACRNNWHVHNAKSGGGQLLICIAGRGWYQEWGKPAKEFVPGDVVHIRAGVKHWHGAASDSWFQHIAMDLPGEETSTEWMEKVDDEHYQNCEIRSMYI